MHSSSRSKDAETAAAVKRTRGLFMLLFLVFYMTDASSGYFMIYLKSIGFDTLQMALLTSAAALVALLIQPFIGRAADRAQSKNSVFIAMLLAAAVLAPMLRISRAFFYILLVYTGFITARNTLHPLADTITLEFTSHHHIPFGPIRTMGCIGYAIMAAVAGMVAEGDPADTFYLYAATALITALVLLFVPKSRGRQSGKKVNPLLIFKNRQLLIYTLFAVAFSMTKSFYHQYFSVYFTSELGGPTNLYGLLVSVAALTEIPLIFSLDRLIRRLGTRRVVLMAACLETLRWLLTAVFLNPYVQLGMHAVLGANNMVMAITMVMFVNSIMPPETKATGQATYTMITSIGSLLLGNLLGGALSSFIGIRSVFFLNALVNVAALGLWLYATRKEALHAVH